jgi:hypothetical protein
VCAILRKCIHYLQFHYPSNWIFLLLGKMTKSESPVCVVLNLCFAYCTLLIPHIGAFTLQDASKFEGLITLRDVDNVNFENVTFRKLTLPLMNFFCDLAIQSFYDRCMSCVNYGSPFRLPSRRRNRFELPFLSHQEQQSAVTYNQSTMFESEFPKLGGTTSAPNSSLLSNMERRFQKMVGLFTLWMYIGQPWRVLQWTETKQMTYIVIYISTYIVFPSILFDSHVIIVVQCF